MLNDCEKGTYVEGAEMFLCKKRACRHCLFCRALDRGKIKWSMLCRNDELVRHEIAKRGSCVSASSWNQALCVILVAVDVIVCRQIIMTTNFVQI